jgi:beta-N-acetylhexosaminidase
MRGALALRSRWLVAIAGALALSVSVGVVLLVLGSARSAPVAAAIATPTIVLTGTPRVRPTATPSPTPTAAPTPTCIDVASWSVSQRVNQLIMVSGDFSNLGASIPYARAGVGAFVVFGQPPAGSGPAISSGVAALYSNARASGQIIPWISTDEEGGSIARLKYVIGALPSPRQMAAGWTPAQVQSMMAAHARAMWNLGVTMDLAPVLDTANPNNNIALENERSFSENPQIAATYGLAYAAGLRSSNVVAVAKHFPGFGHASANTDLAPATDPSFAQLQASDLIPFERAIAAGIPAIMITHASVPGLTGTAPASLSPATYQYLRNTLHFNGVAITDSLSAVAISAAGYSQASAAALALESGADMAMISASAWQSTVNTLQNAVNSGALPLTRVNASVGRILSAKGLNPCTN